MSNTISAMPRMLASISAMIGAQEHAAGGETSFSKLSQEAQDAIVGAICGDYEDGPPDLSESVIEEIRQWASEASP